jgi:hypothetical protein
MKLVHFSVPLRPKPPQKSLISELIYVCKCQPSSYQQLHIIFLNIFTVSHQWCDLFYRLLHSYTRHIERVVRGERDTLLSAQE